MRSVPDPLPDHGWPPRDDLELICAEIAWAEARCARIAGERLARGEGRSRHNEPEVPSAAEVRRRAARETASRARIDEHLAGQPADRYGIQRAVRLFGLDPLERTALILGTACALSAGFGDKLCAMHDDGSGFGVDTLFSFAELDLPTRVRRRAMFRAEAPLLANDLLTVAMGSRRYKDPEDLLCAHLSVSGRALQLLLGDHALSDEYAEFTALETPRGSFDDVVLADDARRRILSVIDSHEAVLHARVAWGVDDAIRYGRGLLLLFTGTPGTGKTLTAHAVAHRLGRRVMNVDIPAFSSQSDAARFLPGLFREARIQNAILFFDECEALMASRRGGNTLMTVLLTELERYEGVAVLATNLPEMLDEALDRRILVRVDFPRPDVRAREAIWRHLMPARAPIAADIDLAALARRYDLNGGYIKNAVLAAVASAVHEGGERPLLTQAHLQRAARDQARRVASRDGGSFALSEPVATLADVHLPPAETARLGEIVAAAQSRRLVFERWGIAAHQTGGRGIVALFTGEPGTGKTLSAEAIAGELHRPLLRVPLPGVLSKFVGEAEARLRRAFDEAVEAEAVLLLDEVDTLLMQRGRAQASRHDDALVNTLLDLLDRHDGVAILATNRPETLDPALDRRVGWRLAFPFPEGSARAAIWRSLVPRHALGGPVDFEELGRRHALAGGRIRNAAIRAALTAASTGSPLDHRALDRSAAEEVGEQAAPIAFAGAADA